MAYLDRFPLPPGGAASEADPFPLNHNRSRRPQPVERDGTDRAHAEAYRDLEESVGQLRSASFVMDHMVRDSVDAPEGSLAQYLRTKADVSGYFVLVLTEEERDALSYAIGHVHDLIVSFRSSYYAAYEAGRDA